MTDLPRFWENRWLQAFWQRAYKENITGLSAMIAYNLVLATFPFTLLILFVVGQILRSEAAEASVLRDLQILLPNTDPAAIQENLNRIRASSATVGLIGALGVIWISSSFWGAVDTAFCRIYHVECRGWVEQKRFSLAMLIVVVALMFASLLIPTIESAVYAATGDLPWGLSDAGTGANIMILLIAMLSSFLIVSIVYWLVPKGHMPWRSIWIGALFFTVTTTAGNFIFPLYLQNSELSKIGGTLGLFLIVLIWFYLVSLAMLAGAVMNSLRHEKDDTGVLPMDAEASQQHG